MRADRPPRAPAPFGVGLLAEPFYRAVVASRNRGFDRGERVTRFDIPVISVGNLSVGGTGKTPMVMRIVEWLREAGARPAIAMRGYGASRKEVAASDEEAEYLRRFGDVPVVAQPDRIAGLMPLIQQDRIDCVVLDDGFQHRFIARDMDIVLIDATRNPFSDRCLPAGWLREPVSSLRRATHVVLTHAEAASAEGLTRMRHQVEMAGGHSPVADVRHEWTAIATTNGSQPVASLRGHSVIAACAIGNPQAFIRAIDDAGAILCARIVKRDHHQWSQGDVGAIESLARQSSSERPLIFTTEKDWVKFERLKLPADLAFARPILRMSFDSGERDLHAAVLTALHAHSRRSQPV